MADLAEEHLRRFLTARAAGDAAAMRLWWEALVIDFHDRMDALIYLTHKGRLDEEEHELAKQFALTKFSKRLIETFRGGTIGELVNATKQLCRGVCIDVQRSSIRARRHAVASLDDTSSWEIEESRKRYEDASSAADAREFIAWALPQISDTYRPVLELTMYGATVPEIMDELDISQDNIYQRRRRGLQDLAKLKELYDT